MQRDANRRACVIADFYSIRNNVPIVLRTSRTTRFSVVVLCSVLVALIVGQIVRPGFTEYWGYQLFQISVTLVVVMLFDAAFKQEGGMTWQTHALIIGATLADTLGNAGMMYDRLGHYDKIVHFASGAAIAVLAYQALRYLESRGMLMYSPVRRAVLAVLVSLLLAGVLWETYEFLSDFVFSSERVYGWTDTAGDLIVDVIGATLAVCVVLLAQVRTAQSSKAM